MRKRLDWPKLKQVTTVTEIHCEWFIFLFENAKSGIWINNIKYTTSYEVILNVFFLNRQAKSECFCQKIIPFFRQIQVQHPYFELQTNLYISNSLNNAHCSMSPWTWFVFSVQIRETRFMFWIRIYFEHYSLWYDIDHILSSVFQHLQFIYNRYHQYLMFRSTFVNIFHN